MNSGDLPDTAPHQVEQIAQALSVVSASQPRMAKAIGSFWGFPECGIYLARIAVDGSDPLSHHKVGLNRETLNAIRALQAIHAVVETGISSSAP
jgi:hypothetical protein